MAEGGGLGPAPELVLLHGQTRRILVLKGLPGAAGRRDGEGEIVRDGSASWLAS